MRKRKNSAEGKGIKVYFMLSNGDFEGAFSEIQDKVKKPSLALGCLDLGAIDGGGAFRDEGKKVMEVKRDLSLELWRRVSWWYVVVVFLHRSFRPSVGMDLKHRGPTSSIT
ncbi:hypothetical protein RJT34_25004 [Clitoria ternatea]|uniref:Uncharacterized protein n=1 Tax=Clitoria ternatea TaxID=43366 RepID=A0AAN9FVU8_CLITE